MLKFRSSWFKKKKQNYITNYTDQSVFLRKCILQTTVRVLEKKPVTSSLLDI